MWVIIDHFGSISSIIGACLGFYILIRELRMASEVSVLRCEEKKRHEV